MSRRTILTLSTAGCLWGAYWAYAFLVTPLVETQELSGARSTRNFQDGSEKPPVRNVQMSQRYLPAHNWTADAKYQFSTSNDTYVYAEEWNRVEPNGAVRFEPFALIWFQHPEQADEEPITIVSQSALLQFENEFDVANPNPGRLIGGSLEGDVRIEGPGGMKIDGRNFIYSESAMRIWSDNAVQFAHGPHKGHAHGLQLDMLPGKDGEQLDSLAVGSVRSVRLRRNVVMNLSMDEDEKPVTVTIRCQGAFEYILETHKSTFEDAVHVHRPTGSAQADTLQCDLLTLIFEENGEIETPQNRVDHQAVGDKTSGLAAADKQNIPEPQHIGSTDASPIATANDTTEKPKKKSVTNLGDNLSFRRLRAEGKNVVLISEANELKARMTELVYDAKTKVAVLLDGNSVQVQQSASNLQCPEITVIHEEGGKINSAWCRGAGTLVHRDPDTQEVVMTARWLKQMRKYPDPHSELDIIELHQQAVVRQPLRDTGLAGELIKLWISPNTKMGNSKDLNASQKKTGNLKPKRLLALKNVGMASPQLQGKTERLEIWFEEETSSPSIPRQPIGRQSRHTLNPAFKRVSKKNLKQRPKFLSYLKSAKKKPFFSTAKTEAGQAFASTVDPISKPLANTNQPRSSTLAQRTPVVVESEKTEQQLIVTADLIRVRAIPGAKPNSMEVAEVWTEGNVHVTQDREPGVAPLRLTGDRLHLKNNGEGQQEVHVFGEPAKIYDQSAYIEGQDIFLDRARNYTWIEGSGLLRLPVKSDLEGNALDKPNILDVWWKEQMTFDGSVADFYGDVRAVLEDSRMRCEQMHIELTERVSFAEEKPNTENVEIRTIVCRDGVEFDSYEYEENKLVGVRKATFWEFSLDHLTGDTKASGPGHVLLWKRGRGKRAGLSPTAVAKANRPTNSESADWEYTRIDFAGKTTGNMKKKHSTFDERVQIVYGPVERPLDIIDPDNLPKDAGWMRCDTLYYSQTEETKKQPSYSQLLANGNAELEGKSFHARADTISYDESKGLYILRSVGNRNATIWRQKTIGDEFSRADAKRMEFLPAKNQLKLDRTTGLQGVQ